MNIPQSVKNCLWSYDISGLDLQKNADLIIFNVLNYGTSDAINWLFANYSYDEIVASARKSYQSAWSKKSLNYWEIVLGFSVNSKNRLEKMI